MDVSVDDEATSSHGYRSSRFSDSFEKTVDSFCMGQVSGFFLTWINTPSSDCVTSFLDEVKNHYNHDIDPTNGQLLEKIEQPETIVDIEEEALMKPSMLHRRRDWTSNLVIHREISIRKNLIRRQQEMERERCNQPAQDTQGREPKENSHVPNTSGASISKEKKLLDGCVLRPAELEDAVGCAEIYNAAVADDDHLTVDTEPVSADRFEVIMEKCRCHYRLPFVVAATQKVDLSDAKNWPSLDAYQQYMRWKQSQPQPEEDEDDFDEHRICGFAFLQPYERGIGGYNDTESPAVKATVFVRPDYRRGGIGSALLQHLLTQTSILYCGNGIKYKWEDLLHGDDSFRTSDFRNVHRIIVHTMVKSEGNQSHKWIDDVMTSFQFEQCGRLSQVYRASTPQGFEWYDQIIWQHWANRIDSIRTLYAGDESECSYDYPGKPHPTPIAGEELGDRSDPDSNDVFGHQAFSTCQNH
ncbi:hypothetical protein LZ30DRAFT_754439 [Colletotrichum cereale]|nr:hypothetical protein LZ30DRAFT_754439 [Colletotrichum cereale]